MKELLNELQETSIFDFKGYITRYNNFYKQHYTTILNYWKTNQGVIKQSIFEEFYYLKNTYYTMVDVYRKHCDGQDINADYFDLILYFNEIELSLDIIDNIAKYLKTSSNKIDVIEEPVFKYFIEQGDTPEKISQKFYGDSEKYQNILSYNNIRYTEINDSNWVGRILLIPSRIVLNNDVEGVIDVLSGDNLLGKDIKSEFSFIADDIETVTSREAFKQAINNLLNDVFKGSIPEYERIGNYAANIIGSSIGSLTIPIIINEFKSLLKLESTLEKAVVNKVDLEDDVLTIEYIFSPINGSDYTQKKIIKF